MNITIFGDSFADDQLDGTIKTEISWVDILREHGHNVINHSRGGTSLYYSYKKYLDFIKTPHYKICDLVIFVITGWGREEIKINGETFYLTSHTQIEVMKEKYADSEEKRKILEGIKTYWAFCKDPLKDSILHNLMVDDIKKREKMFYIDTNLRTDSGCLINISMKELSLMNPSIQTHEHERIFMKEHIDRRKCHLTSVNNRMVGNKILEAIKLKQNTVTLNIDDVVKPELDLEYYFEKHD